VIFHVDDVVRTVNDDCSNRLQDLGRDDRRLRHWRFVDVRNVRPRSVIEQLPISLKT